MKAILNHLTAIVLFASLGLSSGCGSRSMSSSSSGTGTGGGGGPTFAPDRFVYADQTTSTGHQIVAFGFDDNQNILLPVPNFQPQPLPNLPTRLLLSTNGAGELVYGFPGNGTIVGFLGSQNSGALTPIPGSPFSVPGVVNGIASCSGMGPFLIATGGGMFHVFATADQTGALTEVPGSPIPDPDPGSTLGCAEDSNTIIYGNDAATGEMAAFNYSIADGILSFSSATGSPYGLGITSFDIPAFGTTLLATSSGANSIQVYSAQCTGTPCVGIISGQLTPVGTPFATAATPVQIISVPLGPNTFIYVSERNGSAAAPLEGFLLSGQSLTPLNTSPFTNITSPDNLGMAMDVKSIAFGFKAVLVLAANGQLQTYLVDSNTGALTAVGSPQGQNLAFPVMWEN